MTQSTSNRLIWIGPAVALSCRPAGLPLPLYPVEDRAEGVPFDNQLWLRNQAKPANTSRCSTSAEAARWGARPDPAPQPDHQSLAYGPQDLPPRLQPGARHAQLLALPAHLPGIPRRDLPGGGDLPAWGPPERDQPEGQAGRPQLATQTDRQAAAQRQEPQLRPRDAGLTGPLIR
jgi:hypothetical protein